MRTLIVIVAIFALYLFGFIDVITAALFVIFSASIWASFRGVHFTSVKSVGLLAPTTEEMYEEYGLNDPTPEDKKRHKAEDTAAYVEAMRGNADRESWYGDDGTIFWQEYVIDQDGNKHITAQGQHAPTTKGTYKWQKN